MDWVSQWLEINLGGREGRASGFAKGWERRVNAGEMPAIGGSTPVRCLAPAWMSGWLGVGQASIGLSDLWKVARRTLAPLGDCALVPREQMPLLVREGGAGEPLPRRLGIQGGSPAPAYFFQVRH